MEYVGIDLGRAESQISILTEARELAGQRMRDQVLGASSAGAGALPAVTGTRSWPPPC